MQQGSEGAGYAAIKDTATLRGRTCPMGSVAKAPDTRIRIRISHLVHRTQLIDH